ncbi:hypothetical protein C8Q70DRAFT_980001 [Cubamyces menziesii]|uniref:TPR-like protein n=1 Tax=Trametes cubensis TaxID=1111947 RepID=A0AAD7XIP7_9APHY|nr:hypothetical protein C8Q70DRAFT_980001 [Cubamyces menziesii]KAJ8501804.1 hypothetical protein ONZ51_g386 [Trametes cubensis]
MAQGKPAHYWRQLRAALTAGQWDARFPAKDVHGRAVSWSDLLRKFNKHCPGHQDVAELASQTQALSLLLSANAADLDGSDVGSQGVLVLGDECRLAEERIDEALAGYDTLKQMDAGASDSVRAALAYYAYALRRPSECLEHLSQLKDLSDAQGPVFPSGTTRSAPATLQVPGTTSNTSLSSSWTGSFVSAQSSASAADINEGRSWSAVEQIRSICLKGMSYETLDTKDARRAFASYLAAAPLVAGVVSEIPTYVPAAASGASASPDNSSFARYRELWRWVERVLRRGIILGARICDVTRTDGENGALWQLFQQYHACSAHWPPLFRSEQRSTVAVLHLRALILKARAGPTPKPGADKPHRWISTARSVVQEYRAILSVSTSFPKAGERNVKVEDLVDLSVAAWEADGAIGEYAGWVIDVLWWATRLTFNSFKIFRHMSRLFYVAGDPELAKRTLRLYVQIVSKAREASMAEAETATAEATGAFGAGKDIDTDAYWVQTLVHGSRMLSRLALAQPDMSKAVDEAKEAGEMLEKAKTRLDINDKALLAIVQLAEAVWQIAMAYTEQDVLTRTKRFEDSLALLHTSLETHPTPSTHHHLALAYLRPGALQDLQTAIVHARAAVEGDPSEVRHWHLLGLLLTASGDWKAAKEVLEMGASVSEVDLEGDEEEEQEPNGVEANGDAPDGVRVHDYATPENQPNGHDAKTDAARLLDGDAIELPPSSSLLQPLGDRPSPNRQETFEQALQLRMTQLTLSEFVEGPEGTGDKWVEVFQWFSEKREVGIEDRRMSIDSRRASQDMKPPSMYSSTEKRVNGVGASMRTSATFPPVQEQPEPVSRASLDAPIPITVTPASPMAHSPAFSQDQLTRTSLNGREESSGEKRLSVDTNRGKGKKVREVFISGVHKGRARVTTISKKIGHNVGRHNGMHLKRSNSAPDFRALLGQTPFQASSIHLRQHLSMHASQQDLSLLEAPPPPPPPPPPATTPTLSRHNVRLAKDRRLLSNLWLMSSATFRRLGKIEQARGAIQEAEVRDESNPAVWVQLGLYYLALDEDRKALEAFQKALFIAPNDVSATIHLCRVYLATIQNRGKSRAGMEPADKDNVDLAVGLLSALTKGPAWDVPEAWYFLAKMYGLQGRQDRERECLCYALTLSENRPLRDPGIAVGWCL